MQATHPSFSRSLAPAGILAIKSFDTETSGWGLTLTRSIPLTKSIPLPRGDQRPGTEACTTSSLLCP